MNKHLNLIGILLGLCTLTSFQPKDEWRTLFDGTLNGWETYQSYRHTTSYNGQVPKDQSGKPIAPIGYGRNEANVFSVVRQEGVPVLRISGEIYGCLFTKEEFQNYHLKLKVKWGTKKWVPRLHEPMDSGILYHSQGECGVDYFRSWMLSQEFQVIERSHGDFWCIANSQASIRAAMPQGKDTLVYNRRAPELRMGSVKEGNHHFCQASGNYERSMNEWNELELICFGDKSLHIVNGQVVMALSKSSYSDGEISKPLVKGKIQLQSEAAEVFYKDIMIKNIDKLPAAYASYFE
ncbi:MAG: 3-keto-disaccharide hydrolase [Arcticibacter sp.]